MHAASEPDPLKGTREPLLLVATGFFLTFLWNPVTCAIGLAGIALGMHDLRRSATAETHGPLRILAVIAGATSALAWALSPWIRSMDVAALSQAFACFAAASELSILARGARAEALAHWLSRLRWLTPLPYLTLLGWTLVRPASDLSALIAAIVLQLALGLALAVLTLHVRSLALPYARRRAESGA